MPIPVKFFVNVKSVKTSLDLTLCNGINQLNFVFKENVN